MSEEKKRYFFIDQFRGWAVLFMVETHVVNAFLHYGLRSSPAYKTLDFFNGLIAPVLPVHRRLLVRDRGRAQVGRFPEAGQGLLEAVPALPADPFGRLSIARAAILPAPACAFPALGPKACFLGRGRAAGHRRIAAADAAPHSRSGGAGNVIFISWPRRPSPFRC